MSEQKYTGGSCWSECFGIANNGRCRTIRDRIVKEFRRAIAHLRRGESIPELLADAIHWRISPMLTNLFVDPDSYALPAAIRDLENIRDEYSRACLRREARLRDSTCIIVHARKDPYSTLAAVLSPVVNDPDDVEVILDAHDLALTVTPIVFYSGDRRNIVSNRAAILAQTRISEIRSLGGV